MSAEAQRPVLAPQLPLQPLGCDAPVSQVAESLSVPSRPLKRAIDLALAAIALVIALPLIVLVALIVCLDSSGPALVRCERVGWRGRPLRMLKFRKMHDGALGAVLTLDRDERFTRVGTWLARLKLDELPQLWHVLRGEMSLVGPRPEAETFVTLFRDDYDRILEVRPGVLGLSQIAFVCESRILDRDDRVRDYVERILPQKIAIDRLYRERQSLGLDLRILVWSVVAVLLRRQVAVDRTTGELRLRSRRLR